MFKRIAPLFVALSCLFGLAAPASAGYDGPAATTTGNSITLTITGADPNTPVDFNLYDDDKAPIGSTGGNGVAVISLKLPSKLIASKTVTADAQGTAVATFTGLPEGTYSATAAYLVDGKPTVKAFNNLTVQDTSSGSGAPGAGSGSLPNTGSDSSLPLARLGIVLVAAGGVAIFAGQKRRSMMRIDA